MFSDDFFILNRATNFPFPHDNCDEIPTDTLIRMFFSPDYFCQHIARYFLEPTAYDISETMKRAREHPTLGTIGAAFMRLKFLAEVLNVRLLLPKLQTQKKAGGFLKGEVVPIWEWEEKGTERYAIVDNLANQLCNTVIEIVRGIVRNTEIPDPAPMAKIAIALNKEIPQIRARPCEQYAWNDSAPYMLVNYPYFVFVVRAWRIIEKIVSIG